MGEKFVGINIEPDAYEKFFSLCRKEGIPVKKKVKMMMLKEIEDHGDGNPHSTIDQFVQNGEFKVMPAFNRPLDDWGEFIENNDEETAEQIAFQAQGILGRADRKLSRDDGYVKI
jgi:hypothetical protein